MDIQAALQSLGVRDDRLSAAEKRTLDEDGYLPLPGMLTPAQVQALRTRLQELEEEEGEEAGKEVHQEAGTARLANLVNKDPIFDLIWTNPKVLAAMSHVLDGDLKLSSLNSRASLPGHGMQALHCDGSLSLPGFEVSTEDGSQRFYACNSIWLLSDFTPENGATRLVPGSHRLGLDPRKDLGGSAGAASGRGAGAGQSRNGLRLQRFHLARGNRQPFGQPPAGAPLLFRSARLPPTDGSAGSSATGNGRAHQ